MTKIWIRWFWLCQPRKEPKFFNILQGDNVNFNSDLNIKYCSTNFCVQFWSPHGPRICPHSEGFYLSVTLVPHSLQSIFSMVTQSWRCWQIWHFTTGQQSCGKVMFSVVSDCPQEGSPCDHYLWCIGPHHTASPMDMEPHCTRTSQWLCHSKFKRLNKVCHHERYSLLPTDI